MKKKLVVATLATALLAGGIVAGIGNMSAQGAPTARSYVVPHILEKKGLVDNTNFTFDTTIFATYVPGLAGFPSGPGAHVDLYLFKNSGARWKSDTGNNVCNPCAFDLAAPGAGSGRPKQSIRVDDLIVAKGGFASKTMEGFGIIVVSGDVDNVALQGFVVNAHTGPFDVSVFGFEPQPIAASVP